MPPPDTGDEKVEKLIRARIAGIAAALGPYKPGLVTHTPDPQVNFGHCFDNVARKVERDGGAIVYGWTFHHRFADSVPGPGYVFITHHAVWMNPKDRSAVDVTPYPEQKHRPLPGAGSNVLFLLDGTALPVVTGNQIAPLPLRFFALSDDGALTAYVNQLNDNEQEKCRRIYEAGQST